MYAAVLGNWLCYWLHVDCFYSAVYIYIYLFIYFCEGATGTSVHDKFPSGDNKVYSILFYSILQVYPVWLQWARKSALLCCHCYNVTICSLTEDKISILVKVYFL